MIVEKSRCGPQVQFNFHPLVRTESCASHHEQAQTDSALKQEPVTKYIFLLHNTRFIKELLIEEHLCFKKATARKKIKFNVASLHLNSEIVRDMCFVTHIITAFKNSYFHS